MRSEVSVRSLHAPAQANAVWILCGRLQNETAKSRENLTDHMRDTPIGGLLTLLQQVKKRSQVTSVLAQFVIVIKVTFEAGRRHNGRFSEMEYAQATEQLVQSCSRFGKRQLKPRQILRFFASRL